MAVRYYDQAITKKIGDWVIDPNMRILGPSESTRLFQMMSDEGNDKPIKLPIIAISRDPGISIINTNKKALTYDGGHVLKTKEVSATLNAIPIRLSYQVDIYTKYFEEADEYIRNFVFNLINYPRVEIIVPYNGANIEHVSNIQLDGNIADNSSIPERLIAGQFTRMTLRFTIDDAYYFSIPFMHNWNVEESGEVEIRD